ncbi:MAG: hypothetical protein CMH11_00655 [Maritimibacter sp.]|nr:hypothetical protein [Maritimibacter sp.]|tara:strand:+ start:1718 stop:2536 length:819 start_codon:yes stop_codon:yes gene_type:complete
MRSVNLTVLVAVLLLSMGAWAGKTTDRARILAVEAGTNGSLWVLGEDKLHRTSGNDRQSVSLPEAAQGMQALSLAVSVKGTVYIAGKGLGIYRSTDDGRSWKKIGTGAPGNGVNAVVAHSTLKNIVYANSPGEGIFRSENAGESWERVDAGPQEPILTFLHSKMEGSMETGWLFAGTTRGVARSMDCFCFWSDAGDLRGEVTALTYDAEAPMNVYGVVRDTLYHSADGGESWSRTAAPDDVNDLAVVGGELYAGTSNGVFTQTGMEWAKTDG